MTKTEKTMSTEKEPLSKKKLFLYFGAAYAAAALLLVAAVLPAEYGIDPLGIGKLTGINQLAEQREQNAQAALSNRDKITEGVAFLQATPFKTETLTIQIEDLGEVEHKLIMSEGDTVVFSWKIVSPVEKEGTYFDLHGHPPSDNSDFPTGFAQSFAKGEQASQSGAFTAPFSGYFGWYFMNLEEGPIVIEVEVAGYWEKDIELYRAVSGEIINAVDY